MAVRKTESKTATVTVLDDDVTKPTVTVPGDAPADTADPAEHAVSAAPRPGAEAIAAGTVNAVKPAPAPKKPEPAGEAGHRIETYPATRPDGTIVTVTHNIDTGDSTVA